MTREYILGDATDLTGQQLYFLTTLFDRYTEQAFEAIDIQPGFRCLDIGAGSGTSTQMLIDRAGRESVTAIDVDTTHAARQDMVITQHDIRNGVPAGGPFDVIHSRLVLMHLSTRLDILDELIDALTPGGWLIVGDFGQMPRPISTPAPEDMAIYHRVQDVARQNAINFGVSWDWAAVAGQEMQNRGLQRIHGSQVTHSGCGGSLEAKLSHNYATQLRAAILKAGANEVDMKRYTDLWLDPQFRTWFYDFFYWAGQKPE